MNPSTQDQKLFTNEIESNWGFSKEIKGGIKSLLVAEDVIHQTVPTSSKETISGVRIP